MAKAVVVPIRGCNFNSSRVSLWQEIRRWNDLKAGDPNYRNSYVQLKAEPNNKYDPNAIAIWCRGEAFGQLGYVARDYTDAIRSLLPEGKSPEDMICKVLDWTDFEQGTVLLVAMYVASSTERL